MDSHRVRGSGVGAGDVTFAVTVNEGPGRSGSLTIAGATVRLTQEAALVEPTPPAPVPTPAPTPTPPAPAPSPVPVCNFDITPSAATIAATGGSQRFAVAAQSGCGWAAASSVSWITILSGATGVGPGVVELLIAPNTGGARTATVVIAGRQLSIWANPGSSLAHKTFENYLDEGPLAALEAIEQAVGEREATIIGYCLGGTLTSCLLAWMAEKGDDRIKAATFFTTMTDFAEPGELGVFIDEEQLDLIEKHMQEKGYLEARHMQQVFNLMRANDLVWGFVVNNYLMGRDPWRSTCCTGTPTARACPTRCTASTCGTCTRRTCWCSPAASP